MPLQHLGRRERNVQFVMMPEPDKEFGIDC
jgi:hypothetical protein